MPDAAYEKMYRELLAQPIPNEALILPNAILAESRTDLSAAGEPATQHERLLKAFSAFLINSALASMQLRGNYGAREEPLPPKVRE
jgi:hypothetical protein